MGLLWSFFHPLLMLTVYTFVFSVVFEARWAGAQGGKLEFATIVFTGLIVFNLFAECLNRAPNLILYNVNYVKKIVFPLEVLPWVAMGSALFHAAVSSLVLLLFFAAVNHYVNWSAVYLPVIVFPLVVLTVGLSWFLASLAVYLRDVGQTISIITSVLMFMSPVFYPIAALPPDYRLLLQLNPLSFIVEQARNVVIWGLPPDWRGLAIYLLASIVVAWLGLIWFQKTRKGFADVL